MIQVRKEKWLCHKELAKKIGTFGPIAGRYERGDMIHFVEIATKISEVLEVSLDFLVCKSSMLVKDAEMLERLDDISKLPTAK